jgi:hypothetical protein
VHTDVGFGFAGGCACSSWAVVEPKLENFLSDEQRAKRRRRLARKALNRDGSGGVRTRSGTAAASGNAGDSAVESDDDEREEEKESGIRQQLVLFALHELERFWNGAEHQQPLSVRVLQRLRIPSLTDPVLLVHCSTMLLLSMSDI